MHFAHHMQARRPRSLRRGGAILEAALVLPILFTIGFGAVEFGYFIFIKQAVQGASREGARAAILSTATNAKVTTAVSTAMGAAGLGSSGYEVEVKNGSTDATLNVASATAQTPVKVVVRCPWSSVATGLRPLHMIDESRLVSGLTVMSKE